jgi:lipoate-protein ligase B
MTPKEFVQTMRMMPCGYQGRLVEEIVDEMVKEHRTNQASVVRNLQHILQAFSQRQPATDPRNQAAVEFADEVAKIEKPIPYI